MSLLEPKLSFGAPRCVVQLAAAIDGAAGVITSNTAALPLATALRKPWYVPHDTTNASAMVRITSLVLSFPVRHFIQTEAELSLRGRMPHREFVARYTEGLTWRAPCKL